MSPIEMGKICRLALTLDAQVELFHCADAAAPPGTGAQGTERAIRERVRSRRQQLEGLAGRMRMGGVRVRTSVRWDHPAYAGIVRQVQRHKPSFLIAHPTERGRAKRLWLGRNDFKLIEACPCPVLFMKTRRPYTDTVVLAAIDPGHAHGKPAALDMEILGWASRLRDALSAKLLVFHAHGPWEQAMRSEPLFQRAPEAVRADVAAAWRHTLEGGALELAERYAVPRRRVRIAEGAAPETLARFAQEMIADILVMGAAARSGIGRLLIGQTAERVLDALDCDVLIVKPPGFRSSVSPQSTHHRTAFGAVGLPGRGILE
ncbi:MAG: universal stress protein [Proteobacteria bacterium]|nr:universal stress protein [Pseudomonadota bacterium]